MAILNRLSKQEIKERYDSYGLMFGIVPVYVGDMHGECRVETRNWVPDSIFDLVALAFDGFTVAYSYIDQNYEPMFPIKITGAIE